MQLPIDQIDLLTYRLERISADSHVAHLASGYRGALLKWREKLEQMANENLSLADEEEQQLEEVLQRCYRLLEAAALTRFSLSGTAVKRPHGKKITVRASKV